jgi:ketosteroid isomerase-like protein
MINKSSGLSVGVVCVSLAVWALSAPAVPGQEETAPPAKRDLVKITRDCFQVMKKHDIEKLLAFFTDDALFEMDDMTIAGKEQLRALFEFDAVNQSQMDILDLKVEEGTVVLRTSEINESFRLLGIQADFAKATVTFRDSLIEKVKIESPPESQELFMSKFEPFSTWVGERYPEDFNKLMAGGYNAENAKLLLALLKEWREKS